MCGPFAIPLALIAAGSVSKFFGEKQAQRARETTYNAEQRRQDGLTAQQTARFEDSLSQSRDVASEEGQAKAAAAREGSLSAAIVPQGAPTDYMPGSSSAPAVVATATDKANAGSRATSMNLARTLAALGGVGDQMQGANIAIGRNSGEIGQLGSFKAGSANVLDAELRAAANKGSFLRGMGGLAQQIGQAWLTGGMGGGGAAAAAGGMGHEAAGHFVGAI